MDSSTDREAFNGDIAAQCSSTPLSAAQSVPSALHAALIEYGTNSCRLLYIHDASAWKEFHSTPTNLVSFADLTADELCSEFVNDVLPRVYSYQLDEVTKQRLNILELNSKFRRVPLGFKHVPTKQQQLPAQFIPQPMHDFCLSKNLLKSSPAAQHMDAESVDVKVSHTMLTERDEFARNTGDGYKYQLRSEYAALLSAIVLSDSELPAAQLRNAADIHSRLRLSKTSFENTGKLGRYRTEEQSLQKYLRTFAMLKQGITNSISRRNF